MRSPTLPPMRMNGADTSASSAIADCTPLTVVWRSCTTAEIETFISDVSTTSTNIAIDSRTARRLGRACSVIGSGARGLLHLLDLRGERVGGHVGLDSEHAVGRLDVGRDLVGHVGRVDDDQARLALVEQLAELVQVLAAHAAADVAGDRA